MSNQATATAETKTERLVVQLDPELKGQIERLAEREHRTISGQVRMFIEDGLARTADAHPAPAGSTDTRAGASTQDAIGNSDKDAA